jgi:hypothetical protein
MLPSGRVELEPRGRIGRAWRGPPVRATSTAPPTSANRGSPRRVGRSRHAEHRRHAVMPCASSGRMGHEQSRRLAMLFANSLRLIVSKARITVDCEGSTGSRGVLPLPPACVVWDPAAVEAWLAPRQISPSPSCALSMGGEGAHSRLRRRIGLEERHRRRNERRRGFCTTGGMSGERTPRKKIVSFLSVLDAVDQSVSGACAPWRCFRSRPSNTNGDSGGDFHPRTANRSRDRLHTA